VLAAVAVACSLEARAFVPITVKLGDRPLVVTEVHRDFNGDGEPDSLVIALVEGRRFEDKVVWCGEGWRDEGRFSLSIKISDGPEHTYDLNAVIGAESLWFPAGKVPLQFADYNHDGQEDVAVWQYGGCTMPVWFLLAIDDGGKVMPLRVPKNGVYGGLVLTQDGFSEQSSSGGHERRDFVWVESAGAFIEKKVQPGPTITIRNLSQVDVHYVYISRSEENVWGDDRLGDQGILEAGTAWQFEVPDGTYEVSADNADGITVERWGDVKASAELRLGENADATIEVVNSTGECVCELFVGGYNLLARGEEISPGDRRILLVASGTYDLSADSCDGTATIARQQVKVSNKFSWVLSPGELKRHPVPNPRFIHRRPSGY